MCGAGARFDWAWLLLLPVPEAALLAATATARPSPARGESDDVSCRDGDPPISRLPDQLKISCAPWDESSADDQRHIYIGAEEQGGESGCTSSSEAAALRFLEKKCRGNVTILTFAPWTAGEMCPEYRCQQARRHKALAAGES